jgi:site-specific DNA-methyltransferase (adenine-specific)
MLTSIVYNEDYRNKIYSFKDKQFDIAVCDIPYGKDVANMPFLKEMNTTVKQKNGTRLNGNRNKVPYELKDWDKEVPGQEYFDELLRISRHQIIFGVEFVNWTGLGNGRIRWDKGVADGVSFNRYEVAYCSFIDYEITVPLLWAGMMQAKSLKEPMIQQGNKKLNEKRIHPTQKPVLIYDLMYKEFGESGMWVIDTHLGSGSNRIAAYKSEINFIGFEIDKSYFDKEEKRFANFKSQTILQFI